MDRESQGITVSPGPRVRYTEGGENAGKCREIERVNYYFYELRSSIDKIVIKLTVRHLVDFFHGNYSSVVFLYSYYCGIRKTTCKCLGA